MVAAHEKKKSSSRNAARSKAASDRQPRARTTDISDRSESGSGSGSSEAISLSPERRETGDALQQADEVVSNEFQVGDLVEVVKGYSKGLQSTITAINPGLAHSVELEPGKGRYKPNFLKKLEPEFPIGTRVWNLSGDDGNFVVNGRRYYYGVVAAFNPHTVIDLDYGLSFGNGEIESGCWYAAEDLEPIGDFIEGDRVEGVNTSGDKPVKYSGVVQSIGVTILLIECKDKLGRVAIQKESAVLIEPAPQLVEGFDSGNICSFSPQALEPVKVEPEAIEVASAKALEPIAPDPLTQLASEIKQIHAECEQALTVARSAESSALEHAKRAGDLLLQAKKAVKHGGWEAWRQEQVGIPSSTASLYQRVAERWTELEQANVDSLKGADRYFRETKKLKANPQPSAELPPSLQLQPGDVLTTADGSTQGTVQTVGKTIEVAWQNGQTASYSPKEIQTYGYQKRDAIVESLERQLQQPNDSSGGADEKSDRLELPEIDDALVTANLVPGDARWTIENLLMEIGFLAEDEGTTPTDPPNPYEGWQLATDSPNEGMLALCLCAPWGAWWALPTEEFFDYHDHDAAIEWAQGIVDRLERAAKQAETNSTTKPNQVSTGHLRAIAKDQSASAFKLLNDMKTHLPDEVDLLGVADALEEAIMQVLEEWILGEES